MVERGGSHVANVVSMLAQPRAVALSPLILLATASKSKFTAQLIHVVVKKNSTPLK